MFWLPGFIPGSLGLPGFIPGHGAFCWLFGLGVLPACWPWPFGLGCLRAIALPFGPGATANATAAGPGVGLGSDPYGILGSRAGSGLRPNPVTCAPGGSWGRLRRGAKPPGLDVAAFAFGLGRAILAGGWAYPLRRCWRGRVWGLGRTREGRLVSCVQRNPRPFDPPGLLGGEAPHVGLPAVALGMVLTCLMRPPLFWVARLGRPASDGG